MPAFVINGPDIPDSLLEAHEEGRIVFFCGAGISYPAGLPGFKGLVDQMYEKLNTQKTALEQKTYENNQFDITLDLLERRYPGHRFAVRKALSTVLSPSQFVDKSIITHRALLQLATNHEDKVRLVTTNFDRLFQYVIEKDKLKIPWYSAPLLPIPKKSRWDGVVYLHGLLPDHIDETELNRLVFTSGDFGLAYLTERWAARFVTDLFRHYTVCFVGYGINDPVLRYMMDALAADELLGEKRAEAFAFASYTNGKMDQAKIEWETKGVFPLLYEVPKGSHDHSALHRTLKEWADTYRDGIHGKEMIISQHASTPPLAPSRTDYAVGRVLWALTDKSAAKHFANLNPVPPLEWLEPLSERQFEHKDLSRFGVTANNTKDQNLLFSMFHRPAPYTRSPWMCIVNNGEQNSDLDPVMSHLCYWLTRHLNDPKLILWLTKYGNHLHKMFFHQICNQLDKLDRLETDGEQDEIARIIADAPNAIPSPPMRTLWRIFMSGRIKFISSRPNLYICTTRIKKEGLTHSLRMELRENLMPMVTLRSLFRLPESTPSTSKQLHIKDIVEWDLELQSENVHFMLNDLLQDQHFKDYLPDILQDSIMLLRDAMDLTRELEGADDRHDLSYTSLPSISNHSQNTDHYDWTALIKLVRESWLSTAQKDPERARNVAASWWYQSYPVFKRLALYAATHSDVISQTQAIDWLLRDNSWCLWSLETRREAIRLLVFLAPTLKGPGVNELEKAILSGPPREMFKNNLGDDELEDIINHMIWLRLSKFKAAGGEWSGTASAKLDEIERNNTSWNLAEDESDEFPFWIGNRHERETYPPTPKECADLVVWLKKYDKPDIIKNDDWSQRCRNDLSTTSCALRALADEGKWPERRWGQALIAWSEDMTNYESWSDIGSILINAPDTILQSCAREISLWLRAIAQTFKGKEMLFLSLCKRILELNYPDELESDDFVMQAINHPVGRVTEALLQWYYRETLEDNRGLPPQIKLIFTNICNTQNRKYLHGRVLLAAHVTTLYRIDLDWTKDYLLPLFNWSSPVEARAAFEGFMWSPRLYHPLLANIKQPLLEGARHYKKMGRHSRQFISFLTFVALDPGDTFTIEELNDAFKHLETDGLEMASHALVTALEGAQEKHVEYWHNRLLPYLHNIWPKDINLVTPIISGHFARLAVAAGNAFPEALSELQSWIKPLKHPYILFHHILDGNICNLFPEDALQLLNLVVADDAVLIPRELESCLDCIIKADLQLISDPRFVRLTNLAR